MAIYTSCSFCYALILALQSSKSHLNHCQHPNINIDINFNLERKPAKKFKIKNLLRAELLRVRDGRATEAWEEVLKKKGKYHHHPQRWASASSPSSSSSSSSSSLPSSPPDPGPLWWLLAAKETDKLIQAGHPSLKISHHKMDFGDDDDDNDDMMMIW